MPAGCSAPGFIYCTPVPPTRSHTLNPCPTTTPPHTQVHDAKYHAYLEHYKTLFGDTGAAAEASSSAAAANTSAFGRAPADEEPVAALDGTDRVGAAVPLGPLLGLWCCWGRCWAGCECWPRIATLPVPLTHANRAWRPRAALLLHPLP